RWLRPRGGSQGRARRRHRAGRNHPGLWREVLQAPQAVVRRERALDAGRHAECRRAHLGRLSDLDPDSRSGAAAAEVVRLRHVTEPCSCMYPAMLEVEGLCKRFGGFLAVNQVSFDVREGEILGLIGPNGSGKSTTFNLIAGKLQPSEGSIRFAGKEIGGLPAYTICHQGIARTFQIPRPFRKLSLRENVGVPGAYCEGGES